MGLNLASSMVAGLITTTARYTPPTTHLSHKQVLISGRSSPFDVIKTRVMDSGKSGSIVQEVLKLVRTEGMAGFFRGWLPNYSRLGPHTMITLVTFEKLRSWFGMGQI